MTATALLLVRHGETDWNRDRRVQGQTDIPLNAEGRRQAHALASELTGEAFDAVYASDLGRAVETAEILTDRSKIHRLEALRERDFGTWEGLTDTEIRERFPDAGTSGWGDAESTDEMAGRVLASVLAIADERRGENVLVVTHGGPIRALLRHCNAECGRINNCTAVRFEARDGHLRRID